MNWFKFYGQDFLTDSKLGSLNPLQRLMWVGLLCIASQDENRTGVIRFLSESRLKELCGIIDNPYDDDHERTDGTLVTFCNMGLVTMPDKDTIVVTNFYKKQTQQTTSAERVRDWRARNKAISLNKIPVTSETNVMLQRNGRIDKNRIDKNNILPASREKTMNLEPDDIDSVIDLDTGLEESVEEQKRIKQKGYNPKDTNILLQWGITKLGRRFNKPLKQKKHIADMLAAGCTPEMIKEKWEELEDDKFWGDKGVDFSIVAGQIDKARAVTKPNPLLYVRHK